MSLPAFRFSRVQRHRILLAVQARLAGALMVALLVGFPAWALPAGTARLLAVDVALHSGVIRLELHASEVVSYRVWRSHGPAKVVVDVAASPAGVEGASWAVPHPAVRGVRVQPGPLGARLVVDLSYPVPLPTVSRDERTLRVDIPVSFRTVDETFVHPGVLFGSIRAGEVYGPLSVKYLKIDLKAPGLRVDVGLPPDRFGLLPLRQMAARLGALGGVNGGYFHWSGRPLGLVVRDGKLLAADTFGRTAIVLGYDGTVVIERQRAEMELVGPGGSVSVDGLNRPRTRGEVVVFTYEYGPLPAASGRRLWVEAGRVRSPGPGENRAPGKGFVVEYDPGHAQLEAWAEGSEVAFQYRLVPGHPAGVRAALGGGPRLVRAGQVEVTGVEERFQPDVLLGRAPRTAVGVTEDGKLLLVVADGRNPAVSSGLTLEELAELMRSLGARDAMNLDGGGSSTLVLRGLVLNEPSDGDERPVGSGLFVTVLDGN